MSETTEEYLAQTYVLRFYDDMPLRVSHRAGELVQVSRGAPMADILNMLSSAEWRTRQLGAWLALARQEPEVCQAVYVSLLTAEGALTIPELAAAAVALGGESSVVALRELRAEIPANELALVALVDRAIDLAFTPTIGSASPAVNSLPFDKYWAVAKAILSAGGTE